MKRETFKQAITRGFHIAPAVALLGPRQCGKTTLAKMFLEDGRSKVQVFDLEDPADLMRLEDPMLAIRPETSLVVIDEIQRRPELFPALRVLIDRSNRKQQFLILGSASRDLIRQSSESLAGRIHHLEVHPFALFELDAHDVEKLWLRGGFPPSFLANSDADSFDWREDYIRTFLEQDVPSLGFSIPSLTLRRFWMMLTHYHGQIFNASELGRSIGVADTTVRRYLDVLAGTFMVRVLPPWFENIKKRQVKSPKIVFRDSGIFHRLIGVRDRDALDVHPKLGASWEGFAIEEILRRWKAREGEAYFWAIHQQADLDLLIIKDGKRMGYEIKYTTVPKVTESMKKAIDLLKLDSLTVVTPGEKKFLLAEGIDVVPLPLVAGAYGK